MGKAKVTVNTAAPKKKGNTVASFREENIPSVRVPAKIKTGFQLMKQQGHAWLTNMDFSRLSGVNTTDLNAYAEQFTDQTHELGNASRSKLVWFVSAAAKNAALE